MTPTTRAGVLWPLGLAAGLVFAVWSSRSVADQPVQSFPPDQVAFFEKEVDPLLKANCLSCHGDTAKIKGGLRLTSRADVLKGGDSGAVVSLDQPTASRLLKAISYTDDDLKMPPKGKLSPTQIETLTKWVTLGLPYAETKSAVAHAGPPKVDDAARHFWSFRPVVRPAVPEIRDAKLEIRNPIDAFIVARLQTAGLAPAPPTDKASLLRRVTYDLTGLPPTLAELDAFLANPAPDAYEKFVDRLLASPHYGEHWGRHWLDLVRYAETNGYEFDAVKTHIWRYRDYVIRAFNEDKRYDQFVKEQLAGDEMTPVTTDGIIATGYYKLAPFDGGAPDKLQAKYDGLDDVVATTSQVFLGLTANCARCHDHKIDPFPQADYYRLLAFFHNVTNGGRGGTRPIGNQADAEAQRAEVAQIERQIVDLKASIKAFEDSLIPYLTGGEIDDFKVPGYRVDIASKHVPKDVSQQDFTYYRDRVRQLPDLEKRKPSSMAQASCVSEAGRRGPDTFVLIRGNPTAKGGKVEPGFPSVITAQAPEFKPLDSGVQSCGRRIALANWIASADNSLTARVMVNRIWQFHFGRGIVRSSSDYGFRGTPPTHPELLDWLASEFVARGWSVKAMHRLIVLSNAYRMTTVPDPSALAKDPENDLFSHFDLRRLGAEEVRDSILAVSGNLNLKKKDGPSVYPMISKEVLAGQSKPGSGWLVSTPEEQAARSVYVHVKRSLILPILAAFDVADPDSSCPVRNTTTVPTQALSMVNSEFLHEQGGIFAASICKEAGDNPTARVRLVLRRATQHDPTEHDVERGVAFVKRMRDERGVLADEAFRLFCLLALNLNEFVYLN